MLQRRLEQAQTMGALIAEPRARHTILCSPAPGSSVLRTRLKYQVLYLMKVKDITVVFRCGHREPFLKLCLTHLNPDG